MIGPGTDCDVARCYCLLARLDLLAFVRLVKQR